MYYHIKVQLQVDKIEMNDVDFDVSVTGPLMERFNFPKNIYHSRIASTKLRGEELVVGKTRLLEFYAWMINTHGEGVHNKVTNADYERIQQLILVNKPIATIYCTEVGELPEDVNLNTDWIWVEFSLFNK